MRKYVLLAFLCLSILVLAPQWAFSQAQTTDQALVEAIIAQSQAGYRGNCPCPYNIDRAGRRCGKRSAYSRPGGEAPLCYPEDVTPQMLERYQGQESQRATKQTQFKKY